jgi:U3 small nucleolar RNA-associated protein 3
MVPSALPSDKQTLLRHLQKVSPESLALARDWEDVAFSIAKTQRKLDKSVFLLYA